MSSLPSINNKLNKLKQDRQLLEINSHISEYTNYDNIKNPLNFKSWWNTIEASIDAPYNIRVELYEAALSFLPGSYKLWHNYLKEARDNILINYSLPDKRYEIINDLHERALLYMSKMPRIWLDYASFLIEQCLITKTRTVFDRALRALPITQHEKIWKVYIEWAQEINCPISTINIFKRYLMLNPDAREDFVYYMITNEQFNQASKYIIDILNDDMFHSRKGKTKFHYWLLLCEIIETYPDHLKDIDCESIIRHGLQKYTDEIGRLWVALGNYYIKLGVFGKARDIFEEALSKVLTARDFSLVFNAYIKFEQEMAAQSIEDTSIQPISYQYNSSSSYIDESLYKDMEEAFENLHIKEAPLSSIEDEDKKNKYNNNNHINNNTNFILLRLSNLVERRPFLLSSTLIRQNPHNVKNWLKRVKLYSDYSSIVSSFEEAIKTIDSSKAYGKLSELYITYAQFYEQYNDLYKANEVLSRAISVPFKKPEENVSIWCAWAEMHIKYHNFNDALFLIKTVCTSRSYSQYNRSLRLWSLYADLETNLGTVTSVKTVYDKMLELKIATIQTVFNYTSFLESHNFFEEMFKVFEQAIDLFTWPSLYDIWIVYIKKFIKRYKGNKIERVRDMFDQVLSSCPKEKVKIFYYIYSDFEEKFGLLNHSLSVLARAASEVNKEERPEMFSVLIAKTAKYFGITKTRSEFNRAMDMLEGEQVVEIGKRYATIEEKLGEIDRARGIYTHLSQFCDPNSEESKESFWDVWERFEVEHGNVETFQEMESVKRRVRSKYSLNVPMFNVSSKS